MIITMLAMTISAVDISSGDGVKLSEVFPTDVETRTIKQFCRRNFARFVAIEDAELIEMELSGDK